MRVKNAFSEIIMLVLGLTVGSAAALSVTTPGVGLVSGESHRPEIVTIEYGWKTPGMVKPKHDSNNTGADPDHTTLHNRKHSYPNVSRVTPSLEARGNQNVRTNILMLALIVAEGRRSTSESR